MMRTPRDTETFLRQDWFAPAILSNGSVDSCLRDVESLQKQRANFIKMIRERLVDSQDPSSDALTTMGQRIKCLEQALHARVGVLAPDRPQAWFRAPAVQQSGPFVGKLESMAVIGPYPLEAVKQVKSEIVRAWSNKKVDGLSFALQPKNMWGELLLINAQLQEIISLPEPYSNGNLLSFAHELPRELSSESLAAFMGNVAHEARGLLTRLDQIYAKLLGLTEKFWAYQEKELTSKFIDDRRNWTKEDAKAMRDDFKKRRQENKPKPSAKPMNRRDLDSLMSMGFDEIPDQLSLRHRYIELAKIHHPDMGGDELEFKELTQAYSHLSSRLDLFK